VARQKALVDQYCVTCHNNRAKTANFSMENADLTAVGEHADMWERVVRKLRAGVMPPPDIPRPPLDQYEGLRDFLEAELDRAAAGRGNPGSVVLHRLNRTEYANAIRDLLDLEVDVTALLPPDDSARGFDNIAGSLTISPTLLEATGAGAPMWLVRPTSRVSLLALAPWSEPEHLQSVFGADLLDRAEQTAEFLALAGFEDHKPFECVGELEESVAAFRLLAADPRWADHAVVRAARERLLPAVPDDFGDPARALTLSDDHEIPTRLLPAVHARLRA
jgi:hypothetical protein